MRDILFLSHRIPYPPDKGDKIRSYHLLRHLARSNRVHLGAFVDDPEDWRYADTLRGFCASVLLERIRPATARWGSLQGLLTGEALTLTYYRNPRMTAWVRARLAEGMDLAVAYSSAMARFLVPAGGVIRIMDFVDMDSDKWRQYAPNKPWPLSWLYRREGRRLLEWERRVAAEFDVGLFVSDAEAADFRRAAPEVADRVDWYGNGVDTEYFSPDRDYPCPYPEGTEAIVFTGAMNYWPNVDAVTWFAREVLPKVRAVRPRACFYIVGSRPGPEVLALGKVQGVLVTGRVPDIRPYLAHAGAVVAPLRIARGVQNKVLEGMAMARTVIVTPQGLEGLQAKEGVELLLAQNNEEYADGVVRALAGLDLGPAARRRVLADHTWDACLARVDRLLERAA
jgi:sugar transferase (PEP-CTERM/EpsH1 system associated)